MSLDDAVPKAALALRFLAKDHIGTDGLSPVRVRWAEGRRREVVSDSYFLMDYLGERVMVTVTPATRLALVKEGT